MTAIVHNDVLDGVLFLLTITGRLNVRPSLLPVLVSHLNQYRSSLGAIRDVHELLHMRADLF